MAINFVSLHFLLHFFLSLDLLASQIFLWNIMGRNLILLSVIKSIFHSAKMDPVLSVMSLVWIICPVSSQDHQTQNYFSTSLESYVSNIILKKNSLAIMKTYRITWYFI